MVVPVRFASPRRAEAAARATVGEASLRCLQSATQAAAGMRAGVVWPPASGSTSKQRRHTFSVAVDSARGIVYTLDWSDLVAQLDRASASGAEGCGFETRRGRHLVLLQPYSTSCTASHAYRPVAWSHRCSTTSAGRSCTRRMPAHAASVLALRCCTISSQIYTASNASLFWVGVSVRRRGRQRDHCHHRRDCRLLSNRVKPTQA